jgi:hypothetical protein
MDRYLIETPHTAQDCQRLVEEVYAMGYLTHFDWGCKAGVHCGWAIIEAENEAVARLAVPPLVRGKAQVVKLTRLDISDVKPLHDRRQDDGPAEVDVRLGPPRR